MTEPPPPVPPPAPPAPQRIDTQSIKQQLADALGQHGPAYWHKLRLFLAGSCSRDDFNASAAALLSSHQARLHNRLIMAILHNVQHPVPLPSGPPQPDFVAKNAYALAEAHRAALAAGGSAGSAAGDAALDGSGAGSSAHGLAAGAAASAKRKSEETLSPLELKRRFTTKLVMSLNADDRKRLISLNVLPREIEPLVPPSKKPLFPNGIPKAIDSIPRSCQEEGDLPSLDMLRQRLQFVSAIQGLDEPASHGSVELVSLALEHYLKNFLRDVVQKAAPLQRARQHPQGPGHPSSITADHAAKVDAAAAAAPNSSSHTPARSLSPQTKASLLLLQSTPLSNGHPQEARLNGIKVPSDAISSKLDRAHDTRNGIAANGPSPNTACDSRINGGLAGVPTAYINGDGSLSTDAVAPGSQTLPLSSSIASSTTSTLGAASLLSTPVKGPRAVAASAGTANATAMGLFGSVSIASTSSPSASTCATSAATACATTTSSSSPSLAHSTVSTATNLTNTFTAINSTSSAASASASTSASVVLIPPGSTTASPGHTFTVGPHSVSGSPAKRDVLLPLTASGAAAAAAAASQLSRSSARYLGMDELSFACTMQPQVDRDTLERIALESS